MIDVLNSGGAADRVPAIYQQTLNKGVPYMEMELEMPETVAGFSGLDIIVDVGIAPRFCPQIDRTL